MKNLKIWLMVLLASIATVSLTACGDDDEPNKPDTPSTPSNPSNPGSNTNYLATKSVKEVTLETTYDSSGDEAVTIYENFYRKVKIQNHGGKIRIYHKERNGSSWTGDNNNWNFQKIGKVSGLSQITNHIDPQDRWGTEKSYYGNYIIYYEYQFEPGCGYACCFDDGENENNIIYIRFFAKSYKTDASGDITEVTLQYQLY